jgi:hypothetical protein
MGYRVEGRIASLTDALLIDDGGQLHVIIDDSVPIQTTDGIPISAVAVGAQTSVSDNTLTTVATLIANGANRIAMISCSGSGYAKFTVYINSVLKETKRSGPDRNVVFNYNHPLTLTTGDVVDIKVEHYNVGSLEDFEATIFGFKQTVAP